MLNLDQFQGIRIFKCWKSNEILLKKYGRELSNQ